MMYHTSQCTTPLIFYHVSFLLQLTPRLNKLIQDYQRKLQSLKTLLHQQTKDYSMYLLYYSIEGSCCVILYLSNMAPL